MKIETIENIPLFSGLAPEELNKIQSILNLRKFKKGDNIFNEGDIGSEMFIIHTGIIHIYRYSIERKMILSILREGDYFGEMPCSISERCDLPVQKRKRTRCYIRFADQTLHNGY